MSSVKDVSGHWPSSIYGTPIALEQESITVVLRHHTHVVTLSVSQ
jgi:hypothetical protein